VVLAEWLELQALKPENRGLNPEITSYLVWNESQWFDFVTIVDPAPIEYLEKSGGNTVSVG